MFKEGEFLAAYLGWSRHGRCFGDGYQSKAICLCIEMTGMP